MCLSPRVLRLVSGRKQLVGCGHCLECLKAYQDQWCARLNEEVKSWRPVSQCGRSTVPVVFFTLKYRDDSIPVRYLCIGPRGYWFQDSKPEGVDVDRHWFDRSELLSGEWFRRRRVNLRNWFFLSERCFNRVRQLDSFFPYRSSFGFSEFDPSPFGCEYEEITFPGSKTLHPSWPENFRVPFCSDPDPSECWYALEFHTVDKRSVQDWMKRCRRRLEFHRPDLFVDNCNVRFIRQWTDSQGVQHDLPSCAIPKTFKYFITSEYGPLTHRPHLHGCIFGVTYSEFEEFFASDWKDTFGSIDFSVLRPSGGAMLYISKYCSKGGYEHEYASKHFFYPPINGKPASEYHSQHYEMSLADFAIDEAIVRPTFHLISKGIGTTYAFRQEILSAFGAALSPYLTESRSLKYSCSDAPGSLSDGVKPSVSLLDAFGVVQFGDVYHPLTGSISVDSDDSGIVVIRKYKDRDHRYLVGESVFTPDDVENYLIENQLLNKKYNRTYVLSTKIAGKNAKTGRQIPKSCIPCWHLIGADNLITPVSRTTSIPLPRYYRQWLLSPRASALRASAASRLYPYCDASVPGSIRSDGPADSSNVSSESFLVGDEIRRADSYARLRRSADRFFLRTSGIAEID